MPPARDTKTRFQGVYARHREACRVSAAAEPSACNCAPSGYGVVWDRTARKTRKTRRFKRVWRRERTQGLGGCALAGHELAVAGPRLDDAARTSSLPRAMASRSTSGGGTTDGGVQDLESSLRRLPDALTRRRLGDITRGDVQAFIDDMTRAGASGSRVRSVVNAIRSLYRWAQDRDLVGHDPAANVRLPAMEATPRDESPRPRSSRSCSPPSSSRTRFRGRLPATDRAQTGDPRPGLEPR